jgi:hypothetical protein
LKKFDASQTYHEGSKKYQGRFPSIKGKYVDYYKDVVAAIRGKEELVVKPGESRDGIRVIEMARESHVKGTTVRWS